MIAPRAQYSLVNFFAHAWIARHLHREPAFLLGAMLPDFATMCGARLGDSTHPWLSRGIAEHHATDEAFHSSATFEKICREIRAQLTEKDIPAGPTRAIAHLGTELLLDGELCADPGAVDDYLLAIAEGADERLGQHIAFADNAGAEKFRRLHTRLAGYGSPIRYREPAFVAEVLVRILADRPRLAIASTHLQVLHNELPLIQQRVIEVKDALVRETLSALGRV